MYKLINLNYVSILKVIIIFLGIAITLLLRTNPIQIAHLRNNLNYFI